jgi:acyl-CoA thioester hydrolase
MGHLNVRFYVARAMEGLVGAAAALGMPHAFSDHATATLIVREHHIRFLREARAGAPLHMTFGIVQMGEDDALLLQVLTHSLTGAPCATFLTRVVHARTRDGLPFKWPERARAAAASFMTQTPPDAGPRGVRGGPFQSIAGLAKADELGLACVGRSSVLPQDCDVFGRMRAEMVMAQISDGISHFVAPMRAAAQAVLGPDGRVGGAALEYRLVYLGHPRAGDRVELRSAFSALDSKRGRMNHWLLDPETGRAWATAENVSVSFDLDARKTITVPDEVVARLQSHVVPDLAL